MLGEAGLPGSRSGRLMVFGGMSTSRLFGTSDVVNEVWSFRMTENEYGYDVPFTGTWTLFSPSNGVAPLPRFDHTTVAYSDE
jgi:hypothetical protein